MSTHSHIGYPCTICGYPLTGKEAIEFIESKAKNCFISEVMPGDLKIDTQWEITKILRGEYSKLYGEPLGIDAEEEVSKELHISDVIK